MQTHDGLFGRITKKSWHFLENARRCEKGGRYTRHTPCANNKNIEQRYKDKANTFEDKANTFAFKDKENTIVFQGKVSTRLPSQTRRLVTRFFGIDERRFELLKCALHKDALRQITEPQRHCQTFCTANAFNRAVDGL